MWASSIPIPSPRATSSRYLEEAILLTELLFPCAFILGSVSATLLHIPCDEQDSTTSFHYVLLDAGEGTLGQIKRNFGDRWKDVLRAMKLIFISHLHADHHSGLAAVLIERNQVRSIDVHKTL